MLGEVALARGDLATAAGHWQAGLAIAEEIETRSLAEKCRRSVSQLPAEAPGRPPG